MQSPESIADEIMSLFQQFGEHEYAGEQVTQLQHMYQAAQLAAAEHAGDEIVLAAFLHDIGHICVQADAANQMDGFGTVDHEAIGAAFLSNRGFSNKIVRLVQSHVDAKRYLTARDAAYKARLSEASKKTLEYQGGPMSGTEADAFEKDPYFSDIIRMRLWDEAAKEVDQPAGQPAEFRSLIIQHLTR